MFKGRAPKISVCAQWEAITEIAAASPGAAGARQPDHATIRRDTGLGVRLLEGKGVRRGSCPRQLGKTGGPRRSGLERGRGARPRRRKKGRWGGDADEGARAVSGWGTRALKRWAERARGKLGCRAVRWAGCGMGLAGPSAGEGVVGRAGLDRPGKQTGPGLVC